MSLHGPPPLGVSELAIAGGILAAAGGFGVYLGLGLARTQAVAATRMVIQLLLVGVVLRTVFAWGTPLPVAAVLFLMTATAARAAVSRTRRYFAGQYALAFGTLATSGVLTASLGTALVVGADPWWRPSILIPLTGMILGNSLNGVALAMNWSLDAFSERRQEVELRLSLGATRWEAVRPVVTEAVRAGSLPIVNTMAVSGIVSLPGMMTGQVLAGVDPVEAVRYQVVIMCLIAAATVTGGTLFTLGVVRRLFDDADRLRAERIWLRPP